MYRAILCDTYYTYVVHMCRVFLSPQLRHMFSPPWKLIEVVTKRGIRLEVGEFRYGFRWLRRGVRVDPQMCFSKE